MKQSNTSAWKRRVSKVLIPVIVISIALSGVVIEPRVAQALDPIEMDSSGKFGEETGANWDLASDYDEDYVFNSEAFLNAMDKVSWYGNLYPTVSFKTFKRGYRGGISKSNAAKDMILSDGSYFFTDPYFQNERTLYNKYGEVLWENPVRYSDSKGYKYSPVYASTEDYPAIGTSYESEMYKNSRSDFVNSEDKIVSFEYVIHENEIGIIGFRAKKIDRYGREEYGNLIRLPEVFPESDVSLYGHQITGKYTQENPDGTYSFIYQLEFSTLEPEAGVDKSTKHHFTALISTRLDSQLSLISTNLFTLYDIDDGTVKESLAGLEENQLSYFKEVDISDEGGKRFYSHWFAMDHNPDFYMSEIRPLDDSEKKSTQVEIIGQDGKRIAKDITTKLYGNISDIYDTYTDGEKRFVLMALERSGRYSAVLQAYDKSMDQLLWEIKTDLVTQNHHNFFVGRDILETYYLKEDPNGNLVMKNRSGVHIVSKDGEYIKKYLTGNHMHDGDVLDGSMGYLAYPVYTEEDEVVSLLNGQLFKIDAEAPRNLQVKGKAESWGRDRYVKVIAEDTETYVKEIYYVEGIYDKNTVPDSGSAYVHGGALLFSSVNLSEFGAAESMNEYEKIYSKSRFHTVVATDKAGNKTIRYLDWNDPNNPMVFKPTDPDIGGGDGGVTEPTDPDSGGGDGDVTEPTDPDNGGGDGGVTEPTDPDIGGGDGDVTEPTDPDNGGGDGGVTEPTDPDIGGGDGDVTEPTDPDSGGGDGGDLKPCPDTRSIEVYVHVAELSKRDPHITNAIKKIEALPDCEEKAAFEERIHAIYEWLEQYEYELFLESVEKNLDWAGKYEREPYLSAVGDKVGGVKDPDKQDEIQGELDSIYAGMTEREKAAALKNATTLVGFAERYEREPYLSRAEEALKATPPSDEKTALEARFNAVMDKLGQAEEERKLAAATEAVEKAETAESIFAIEDAQALVDELKDSEEKAALEARLAAIEITDDMLAVYELKLSIAGITDAEAKSLFEQAYQAIETAESEGSRHTAAADEAMAALEPYATEEATDEVLKGLVGTLTEYLDRVKRDQAVQLAATDAENAVSTAERYARDMYVTRAETALAALKELDPEYDTAELEARLQVVRDKVADAAQAANIANAEKQIGYAERYKRDPYLSRAQAAIDVLPDSDTKTALQERLDAVMN